MRNSKKITKKNQREDRIGMLVVAIFAIWLGYMCATYNPDAIMAGRNSLWML